MSATKVKLRKRTLPSGKITLYLDFYPPVRNPKTLELSRQEYLGIYLKSNPRTLQDREENAEKIRGTFSSCPTCSGISRASPPLHHSLAPISSGN